MCVNASVIVILRRVTDIKSSKALQEILHIVLVAGNFLNAVSLITHFTFNVEFIHSLLATHVVVIN